MLYIKYIKNYIQQKYKVNTVYARKKKSSKVKKRMVKRRGDWQGTYWNVARKKIHRYYYRTLLERIFIGASRNAR